MGSERTSASAPAGERSGRRVRAAGLLVAFSLLVGVATLAYQRLAQFQTDVEWNDHTHLVIEAIESTRAAMLAADSTRRSYRMSFEQADRDALDARIAETWSGLDRVASLTLDNGSQQARIATLRPLLQERVAIVLTGLDLPHWDSLPQGTRDEQRAIQARGLTFAKQIRVVFEAMLVEEQRLLVNREAQSLASSRSARLAIITGGALGLTLVAVFFVSLDSENRRRIVAQRDLQKNTFVVSAVIEGTTDVITVKDLTGRILLANHAAAKYFRRSDPGEVIGKTVGDIMSPEAA